MYSFFAFAFKVCKKGYYYPKKFHDKYQYVYLKTAEFFAEFNKFIDAGFQNWS